MLVIKEYDRERALAYAERWALGRNPLYYNYTGLGGNCTNFVSQCLYAGSCTMNYTPTYGWYYLSPAVRSAAWTGVEYFYRFLTENVGRGPFAEVVGAKAVEVGDAVQLGRREGGYYHTLLIVGREGEDLLVAANSEDALRRPLSTYEYDEARFLHISGVRLEVPDTTDCFRSLFEGIAILPDADSLPPFTGGEADASPLGEAAPAPSEEVGTPAEAEARSLRVEDTAVFLPSEDPTRGPA